MAAPGSKPTTVFPHGKFKQVFKVSPTPAASIPCCGKDDLRVLGCRTIKLRRRELIDVSSKDDARTKGNQPGSHHQSWRGRCCSRDDCHYWLHHLDILRSYHNRNSDYDIHYFKHCHHDSNPALQRSASVE